MPTDEHELEVTYEVPDGDRNRTLRDRYPTTHSYAWRNSQVDIYELFEGNHRPVASYSYNRVICVRRVRKDPDYSTAPTLSWPDPGQVLNPRPSEVSLDDGFRPLNLHT